ncbi:hypothetical protein [uncultured Dubosiella sp.]|nr:hypothetical protein [uncultured Dubosiella sp.]
MAESAELDTKTLRSWYNEEIKNINRNKFDDFITSLKDDAFANFNELSDYIAEEFYKNGILYDEVKKVFDENKDKEDFHNLIKQLLDLQPSLTMQDYIGRTNIIDSLKSNIQEHQKKFEFKNIRGSEKSSISIPSLGGGEDSELNYLILNFRDNYSLAIIFANQGFILECKKNSIENIIDNLKDDKGIKMILVFVDIMDKEAIPFDSNFREKLMKKYNLFFEFIREKELYSIPIQGLVMEKEEKNISKSLNRHRYAKLVFDKIIRYFPIIEDEIIFNNLSDNINKISNPLTGSKKFEKFAKKTLIKDIYNYDYLSRHSIYFERSLVFKEISKNFKGRRPVIVEFGAFNSLITYNVIEESEKAFLFTDSFHAYDFMKKLNSKCNLFDDNVNIKLYSLDLLNIVNECLNQINKKADVIVVGFGLGSRIGNLTEFIRYIYSWLSDKGILFISFYNQDYFDLIKCQNKNTNKLYSRLSYEKKEDSPLLKNYKSYSVRKIKNTVLNSFKGPDIDIYTYPYLSGIIKINEYNRLVLDEIREADKNHAKQGKFGQVIYAIAHKKDEEVKNESSKNEELIFF